MHSLSPSLLSMIPNSTGTFSVDYLKSTICPLTFSPFPVTWLPHLSYLFPLLSSALHQLVFVHSLSVCPGCCVGSSLPAFLPVCWPFTCLLAPLCDLWHMHKPLESSCCPNRLHLGPSPVGAHHLNPKTILHINVWNFQPSSSIFFFNTAIVKCSYLQYIKPDFVCCD